MQRRHLLAAALAWPALARAAWPAKPVRLLVAYPPGGVSNDMARVLALALAPRLGVPVLVENRPGAGGSVAMELLARAPADGHTLCFSAITPLTLMPQLAAPRYDPQRDIAPVLSVMLTPVLVVGTPALRVRTLPEVLAQARAQPGGCALGHHGAGHYGPLRAGTTAPRPGAGHHPRALPGRRRPAHRCAGRPL